MLYGGQLMLKGCLALMLQPGHCMVRCRANLCSNCWGLHHSNAISLQALSTT